MADADIVRMWHMLEAAREAIGFATDVSPESFGEDRMLMLAIVKDVEIIGEAASRVSSEVPWRAAVATRNRLVHVYFAIDPDQVRRVVHEELPVLVAQLEAAIAAEERRGSTP